MNVIFLGDSICFGQGVSPHKTWVTRLSALTEEMFGDQFVVINTSVNGNTTRMALERMPHDVQAHGLGLLILQFGMNDCNLWQTDNGMPRVSPEAFRHNLLEIIDRARIFGTRQILLNTNHPTLRHDILPYAGKSYEESNLYYNTIIREVSRQREDVILVDIEAAWKQQPLPLAPFLLPDGLHLSVKGHELYFQVVKPVFVSALRRMFHAQ